METTIMGSMGGCEFVQADLGRPFLFSRHSAEQSPTTTDYKVIHQGTVYTPTCAVTSTLDLIHASYLKPGP